MTTENVLLLGVDLGLAPAAYISKQELTTKLLTVNFHCLQNDDRICTLTGG